MKLSKYNPLWLYLKENGEENYKLTFDEIEKNLGFKIDHSFLTYKKESVNYGYTVEKISMKDKTVEFIKIEK